MDNNKLKYYTTAAWLRGYASSFDPDNKAAESIVYKLGLAAELLQEVWDEYANKEGYK